MKIGLHKALKEHEKELIIEMLYGFKWNKPKTAEALGIGLSSLYRKIKELNIRK